MRFHLFKTSPTRNLTFTYSQGRNLTFHNFNIPVLPGAQVEDVRPFLPAKGRYDLIVVFVGGNDLPTGNIRTLARNISDPAVAASEVALRIFGIAVPPLRRKKPDQAKALKRLVESKNDCRWLYRCISRSIYSVEKHPTRDDIHLEPKAISGIRSILKNRVLRKAFCPQIDKRGHPQTYECRRVLCTCPRSVMLAVFR